MNVESFERTGEATYSMQPVLYVPFLFLVSIISLFVYKTWGLTGSAVWLGISCIGYVCFLVVFKRHQARMKEKLSQMTLHEIDDALSAMDESLRKEVIEVMKKEPERYHACLKRWEDS